jgi:tetratricopeptide (TPR) repeat protein
MNLFFKNVCFCLIALNVFAQLGTPSPAEKYALEPGVAEVHANPGLIYFEEKKFEQAVPALRQALKLKPSLIKSDNILAMSLSELGRYN